MTNPNAMSNYRLITIKLCIVLIFLAYNPLRAIVIKSSCFFVVGGPNVVNKNRVNLLFL